MFLHFLVLLFLYYYLFPAYYAYHILSDRALAYIPHGGESFDPQTGGLLAPLLIPRVVGTANHTRAQEHFANFFRTHLPDWQLKWQNFSATAPFPVAGLQELPFKNLILRREPPWVTEGEVEYLTFAAHYDSKYTPEGFIGATDSAVPCAVLMHVAQGVDQLLHEMHEKMISQGSETNATIPLNVGLQILLFDGEEAFGAWSDTDSLYGSKALASEWEATKNPPLARYSNPLSQISLFVLLDLLGASGPLIPSYFDTTRWAYEHLATVERRMRNLGLLESIPAMPFLHDAGGSLGWTPPMVEDDHLPFMKRGVPILHLIPTPYPEVWHTLQDNGERLDMATIRDWAAVMTAFAIEWMDMMAVIPNRLERSLEEQVD